MKDKEFDILYKRLNPAQKQAVDTIEGPIMVIAGPGTGKTSILTLRIANILKKTDISPENILALTFTESGAYAMKKKLVSIIGTSGYKVNINTFHGFCNEIIKQYPEKFPRIIGSISITEIDQIAIMEKIIQSENIGNKLELLKPYGDINFYIKPVLNEIKQLKREALGVSDLQKIILNQEKDFENIPDKIHEKGAHKGKMKGDFVKLKDQIAKNKELLILYDEYEKQLIENKFYDFEDMIVEVIKTLKKDEELLLILQETYQYILADEHQDANNSQNSILELLSNFHKNPNLFIVGDEKQAIYRFQGASLDNFLYFKKMYEEAVLINLEDNYRSTQNILDASHSLISNNTMPKDYKRVELKAKAQKGKEPIFIYELANKDSQNQFLINDIKDKLKSEVKASEIAILYRDNKDAIEISNALEKTDIPFRIESENDILKDEDIRKLLIILEAINDITNEEKMAEILFIDFIGLEIRKIYSSIQRYRKERLDFFNVLDEDFADLMQKVYSWASYSKNKPFIELFEKIINESGYLEYALSNSESMEKMATLDSFFNEIKALSQSKKEYYLKDFIEHLNRVKEHGILTRTGKGIEKEGIRLMTAHKSKGLEFDYVYIIDANDGHWGNKIKRKYFNTIPVISNSIDDERRLFYVAMTRARKAVYITHYRENNEGKELLPTQFISEISDDYKNIQIIQKDTNQKTTLLNKKDESITHTKHEIKDREYLRQLFLERGLAVTALNNYLKCPWEYFFINLIRLPKAQTKHQMYGTAIHETLQTFFNKYREENDMDKNALLNLFESNLKKMFLSKNDFNDSLKKGKESLSGYFDTYKGLWNRNLITEYSTKVHLDTGEFTLILNGKLDKIEMINDRDVNVVDYKTGKRKSDNKENYERQLRFYRLLLSLDDKKRYNMISGELDFIEPDNNGKYRKDRFEIIDKEVEDLKNLVIEKAREIYNFDFWDKSCEDKDCEYCRLSKTLN